MDDRTPILDWAGNNPIPSYTPPTVTASTTIILCENGHVLLTESGHVFIPDVVEQTYDEMDSVITL